MKTSFHTLILIVVLLALLLGACTLPTTSRSGFSIYLSDPVEGAVVPVGSYVLVDANAFSSAGDITNISLYANGVPFMSNSGADLSHPSYGPDDWEDGQDWRATEAGEFFMQATAIRSGGLVSSAPVRVCVVDFSIDAGDYLTPSGYEGVCPIPARDSAARPGAITLATDATPDSLIYIPPIGGVISPSMAGCTPRDRISFQATVIDPPEDVAMVAVFLSLPTGPMTDPHIHTGSSQDNTLVLSQTGSFAGSTRIFTGSTDADFASQMGFVFGDAGADVTWTAKAIGRDGSILLTDGPHTIPATPCGATVVGSPEPLIIASTPTNTPQALISIVVDTATSTPGIISIIPTNKGGKHRCASFTDSSDCNNNGCSWQNSTGTCHSKPNSKGCSSYNNPSACTSNGCSWDKGSSTCH